MFSFLKNLIKMIVIHLPGKPGFVLRNSYYKKKFKSLGKNFLVEPGVNIEGYEFIEIGDNVRIDRDCIIHSGKIKKKDNNYSLDNSKFNGEIGNIYIGDEVRVNARSSIYGYGGVKIGKLSVLAEGTKIFSSTHIPFDPEKPNDKIFIKHSNNYENTPSLDSPILIDENSFIAVNCVLFPGSHIGKDSFVAPTSVVKGSFEDNSYIEGNPAIKTKNRFG